MELSDLVGRPLAIEREYLVSLVAALQNGNVTALRNGVKSYPALRPGIVQLAGVLTPEPTVLSQILGWTSLREFREELEAALADSSVSSVSILVDSPGGNISGISETMDFVRSARSRKPVNAFVTGMAASAAYFVISGASRIYTADAGLLGSVGIVSVHNDDRGLQDRVGVRRYEIVSAGAPHKRPDLATEAGRAVIQQQVDDLEAVFIGKVASNRGVSVASVSSNFGKGGLIVGQKAVAAGMADGVKNFAAPAASPAGASAVSVGATIEARCKDEWERNPLIRAEFIDLASFTAYEKAAAGGRFRIRSGPQGGNATASRADVAPNASEASIEASCRSAWSSNEQIRREFGTLKAYTAYAKAEARGAVRIHGGCSVFTGQPDQ